MASRWDRDQQPNLAEVVDSMITMTVHSGLFSNFIGCLAETRPPEYIISMVHHFLNSLATGPYPSLNGFQIQRLLLDSANNEFQIQVAVQNGDGLWHTHFITCRGDIIVEKGEILFNLDEEDENGQT